MTAAKHTSKASATSQKAEISHRSPLFHTVLELNGGIAVNQDEGYTQDHSPVGASETTMLLHDKAMSVCSEGITIADASQPDNPLIYVNDGFLRLTGYSREETIGHNCRFLQGPDTDPEALEALRKAIREETPCAVDLLNYRKDGSTFWNRLSVTPIFDDAGKVAYFIGIQSDTTERVAAEEQLKAAWQHLKAANYALSEDLRAAANIQQALLPEPKTVVHAVETAWRFEPCESLAGDLLNIIPIQDRYLVFYILDVAGHGTPAALLSVAISRMLMPTLSSSSLIWDGHIQEDYLRPAAPSAVANELNRAFPWDAVTGQFFTIVYGVLDTETGEVRYITAGHPGMLQIPKSGEALVHKTPGLPIGVGTAPYEEGCFLLSAGDRLVAYSDGATDSMSAQGKIFGEIGLMRVLEENRHAPLAEMLDTVLRQMKDWRSGAPCHDDVTLITLCAAAFDAD
jgi:PAS domain S-box-containing protein